MQCGHCRMRGGCSSLGRAKRIEKNMRSASSHCEQRSAACAGLQHPDVHPATDEDPSFGDSSANVRDGSRAVTGVNDGPKPQLAAAPRARRSAWLPTPSDQRAQRRPRSIRPGREAGLTPRRATRGLHGEGELDGRRTRRISGAAIGEGSLGRRPADSLQERDPRFSLTRSGHCRRRGAGTRAPWTPWSWGLPTGHPPDQHLP